MEEHCVDESKSDYMKLFLFGLDGMPLDIMRPYSKKAEFTNFRKLLQYGSAAPAWTSMFTGINPSTAFLIWWKKPMED
jgi:predicted AlkP superfamily phosphohydrolase/phosphomutase